jgi:hypothetical protein
VSDPILKKHGALAYGIISVEEDDCWRARLSVQDLDKDTARPALMRPVPGLTPKADGNSSLRCRHEVPYAVVS